LFCFQPNPLAAITSSSAIHFTLRDNSGQNADLMTVMRWLVSRVTMACFILQTFRDHVKGLFGHLKSLIPFP